MSTVDRDLPTDEARALLDLTRQIAQDELAPRAAEAEAEQRFPTDQVSLLGRTGLLGLPYAQEWGGGGQPYEVYLQVLEELAWAWGTVALTVSVHGLSCFPVAQYGTPAQRHRWLPGMLAGTTLGAYCLSEPHAGSDAAALRTRADRTADGYRLTGTKAWITHGGIADVYNVLARTGRDGPGGISCVLVPSDTRGLSAAPPEHKMGFRGSPTTQIHLDGAEVDAEALVGEEGQGFGIAMAALDAGRLGIAAVATGIAQAALEEAVRYTRERHAFGRPVIDFQGLAFDLADMAASVAAARALYLDAARRRDRGSRFTVQAATAKLVATEAALAVTTKAVMALGGAGYVTDHPVERLMREATVLPIVEGTNHIQRVVIARALRG